MSAFGAKRKARKITVQDDDDAIPANSLNPPEEPQGPALQPTFKSSRSKPFKQSSLRKSINIDKVGDDALTSAKEDTKNDTEDDENGGAPLRIRPSLGRSGSTKIKKRVSTSRLSFGVPSEDTSADEDSMIIGEEVSTPKRPTTLAHSVLENSAYKKGIAKNLPLNRLPMRSTDADENRPRYSKEYLSELQMSTPNTPQDLSKVHPTSDDEMDLDPSELEGATIVETASAQPDFGKPTTILTEAEIQEKKSRRARLAQEGQHRDSSDDFISLSDSENAPDGRRHGDSYLSMLSQRQDRKSGKESTRLVREDEDLGEGFDEFVEDGGLSLGKKAERAARKRQRKEMASLIAAAEGGSGEESDDSEAERRAAYEKAQTRAGMDGLAEEREQQRRRLHDARKRQPLPAPMPAPTPLPDVDKLAQGLKAKLQVKQSSINALRARIAAIEKEEAEIARREPEVQTLLNQAGERYRAALMAAGGGAAGVMTANGNGSGAVGANATDNVAAAKSLLDRAKVGVDAPRQRGLESLGTTPVKQRSEEEDDI
ncbi:nineteen complex-related protein 2-domain-containing protein [Jackrogersella minutella]|nr:nineteen complex-related protein 2-domain-containing protein [Jackrogersella minutella]